MPVHSDDIATLFDQIGDLLGNHCQRGPEEGMLLSINSDAHRAPWITPTCVFGWGQARMGLAGKGGCAQPPVSRRGETSAAWDPVRRRRSARKPRTSAEGG